MLTQLGIKNLDLHNISFMVKSALVSESLTKNWHSYYQGRTGLRMPLTPHKIWNFFFGLLSKRMFCS